MLSVNILPVIKLHYYNNNYYYMHVVYIIATMEFTIDFSYSFYWNCSRSKKIKFTCHGREDAVPKFTNTKGAAENITVQSFIT